MPSVAINGRKSCIHRKKKGQEKNKGKKKGEKGTNYLPCAVGGKEVGGRHQDEGDKKRAFILL